MPRPANTSRQTRLLFAALNSQPQAWRYGYDLSKETGLKSGTLYPLLIRLCDQGLLEAEWRPSPMAGRPARHAYRLTGEGQTVAAAQAGPPAAAQRRSGPEGAPA